MRTTSCGISLRTSRASFQQLYDARAARLPEFPWEVSARSSWPYIIPICSRSRVGSVLHSMSPAVHSQSSGLFNGASTDQFSEHGEARDAVTMIPLCSRARRIPMERLISSSLVVNRKACWRRIANSQLYLRNAILRSSSMLARGAMTGTNGIRGYPVFSRVCWRTCLGSWVYASVRQNGVLIDNEEQRRGYSFTAICRAFILR